MARANRGPTIGRAHVVLGAAAGLGVGAGLHTEHVARLGRRGQQRGGRQRAVLASHRRNVQVRVRQTHRPRRPFTL